MKRYILFSPVFAVSFFLGTLAAFLYAQPRVETKTQPAPERFEVYLAPIKDSDPDRKNSDRYGSFLSLYDAEFLDDDNILGLSTRDGIRRSQDGGKTWQRMFVESGGIPKSAGGLTLQSLEFLDPSTGWAAGSSLISTRDGGRTWQDIKLPEWMDNLRVKFLNENVGYVAGRAGFCNYDTDRCNTSLTVYKTADGGKTWKKSFRTRDIDTPWDIETVDENIAMLTGGASFLYRTRDGGRSWKAILSEDDHHVMSISRAPDGRFWLFGTNSIRVSDDLGATWRDAENIDRTVIDHEWESVDFTREGLGVAVGEDAAIAITRDGGRSWKEVTSNLHYKGKLPIPDNPYNEGLRGIRLYGNKGIITGSQRDYLITIADPSGQ